MNALARLQVAWRLARRELRGSVRGLSVFLACLTLGVASIAAVGVINAGVMAGLERDAKALLGGDVSIESTNLPLGDSELAALVPEDAQVATTVRTNAMAFGGDDRVVTSLKAVSDAYPLFGEVRLNPAMPLSQALADGGVVVEQALLARLRLEVGDVLRIGEADFEIRAVLEREPDRTGGFISIGPRAMIAFDQLERTGAIMLGSLVRYGYGLALPAGVDAAALVDRLRAENGDAAWRVRDTREAQPRVTRFTDRLASYLTIAGLTSLLIGGLGVALAIQNYLGGKITTIATLKCLGAPSRLVFLVYLLQVLALATAGIVLGLLLGQGAPLLMRLVPDDVLPAPVLQGLYPVPLLIAAGCGYLAALAFTLYPLARARDVSAASIFRSLIVPGRRWLPGRDLGAIGLCLAGLGVLALIGVGDRRLGLAFIGVAIVAALALAGLARLLLLSVGRLGSAGSRATVRLAIANLCRPGSGSASVVVALGAGLTVLTMVALLQHNLMTELQQRLPERAPSFFFIDIQPNQIEDFEQVVAGIGAAQLVDKAPLMRGRVIRIAGQPVDQVMVDPEVQWTVRRDRGLTFTAEPPAGLELVRGSWWPARYDGPPLVSVDEEVARGYGVGIGDRLGFNVLGRTIEAEIASTRDIAWEEAGMNWVFIFSPGTLDAAPYTWVATVESDAAIDNELIAAVTDRLPNVTPISVREIVVQLGEAFSKIAIAITAVGGVTLLAGILVLAGAVAAARRRHLYEAVVLKVLGARRGDLLRIFAIEYLGLGLAAALAGAVLGTLGAFVVVVFVMELTWSFSVLAVLRVLLVALAVTLVAGFIGTWRLLGRPVAPVLRTA